MSHTNSTSNYGLPQWIGTDKPTFLGDFNTAFYDIDAQMKANADASASATTTANTAASAATTASTNATTALNIANSAASEAASATSAATSATATANTAASNAATALTASQANNIANLAPAYDPTLTYSVGDLVTYVDTETNTGKLYKCIVAVASPMAFNLNYWDDVTTSEVYQPIRKTLVELTADGVKTWSDMLNELFPYISNIDRLAEIYYIGSNGIFTEKYIITTCDGTVARALNSVYVAPNMNNKFLNILTNASSKIEIETNVNTSAITVTNSSSNVVPSGAKIMITSF